MSWYHWTRHQPLPRECATSADVQELLPSLGLNTLGAQPAVLSLSALTGNSYENASSAVLRFLARRNAVAAESAGRAVPGAEVKDASGCAGAGDGAS